MKREKIRDITFVSLCVAILAVMSQLSIPVGAVPITLQVLAVSLIGYFLGAKRGVLTVVIYILLGTVGAPIFSGFQGGIGVILGYTGGFIFGFIPLVLLCGINMQKTWLKILFGIFGLTLCHLIGTFQYMLLSKLSFISALVAVSLPYIIKDVILTVIGCFVSSTLKKRLTFKQ